MSTENPDTTQRPLYLYVVVVAVVINVALVVVAITVVVVINVAVVVDIVVVVVVVVAIIVVVPVVVTQMLGVDSVTNIWREKRDENKRGKPNVLFESFKPSIL